MQTLSLSVSASPACTHEDWDISAVPRKAGHGFILSIQTITCKSCGAVANLTDARGHRGPATSIGIDFNPNPPLAVSKPREVAQEKKQRPEPEPLGEGPGTELALELERLGMSSCQQCKHLAGLMNNWGPQGCRERLDEIVVDVLPRARAWFDHASIREKLSVWWNSNQKLSTAYAAGVKASSWELDETLKEVIKIQVLAALDRWDAKASEVQ